jgi:serine/threonine protein kinase
MIARFHYDNATLERLRFDQLREDEAAVTDHVEACEVCQQQLETLSQGGMTWEEVGRLLSSSPATDLAKISGREVEDPKVLATCTAFLQPSTDPDSIGRFARYEVREVIGRGGMGVVMRAFDPSLGRYCAVKVLAPELAGSAAAKRRFSREAKSAAAVVHPHVVPIQTVDQHGGLPYLVMPVVEGQSLQQRVEASGPLSVIETVRIASQIAEGLAAAHDQGLVHRDIKPANILLENGVERVQITDFGLARAVDDASMTRSGVIAGTPQYMSPEQAHGDAIDHRSDLFSLGSVVYFMLTGHSPFRAETTMGVLNRIGNDEPRSLRSVNADVPDWLESIVNQLLAKAPEARYASASQVAELLQNWHAHLQSPDTIQRPTSPLAVDEAKTSTAGDSSRRPPPKLSRGLPPMRWLIALAAFGFCVVLGSVIYLETNTGTLRIETNSHVDVPIRILQGGETVAELTISSAGSIKQLKAGRYTIAVDDAATQFSITGDRVELTRGDTWVAKITVLTDEATVEDSTTNSFATPEADESQPLLQALQGAWNVHYTADRTGEDDGQMSVMGDVMDWTDADGDVTRALFSINEAQPHWKIALRMIAPDIEVLERKGIVRRQAHGVQICMSTTGAEPTPTSFENTDSQVVLELTRPTSPREDAVGQANRTERESTTNQYPVNGIRDHDSLVQEQSFGSPIPKPADSGSFWVRLESDDSINWSGFYNGSVDTRGDPSELPANLLVQPNKPGVQLLLVNHDGNYILGTVKCFQADGVMRSQLQHDLISTNMRFNVTVSDFDQVKSGIEIVKVLYLADGERNEIKTLTNRGQRSLADLVAEVNRRGKAVVSLTLALLPNAIKPIPVQETSRGIEAFLQRCPAKGIAIIRAADSDRDPLRDDPMMSVAVRTGASIIESNLNVKHPVYILVKDRLPQDVLHGPTTKRRFREFIEQAGLLLTPMSIGLDARSVVRVDCYINEPQGRKGTMDGQPFSIPGVVVASVSGSALVVCAESVAGYLEAGFQCVIVCSRDDGQWFKQPMATVFAEKAPGRDGKPSVETGLAIYETDGPSNLPAIEIARTDAVLEPQTSVLIAATDGFKRSGAITLDTSDPLQTYDPVLRWQTQKIRSWGEGTYGPDPSGFEMFEIEFEDKGTPIWAVFSREGRLVGLSGLTDVQSDRSIMYLIGPSAIRATLSAAASRIEDGDLKSLLRSIVEE